MIGGPPAVSEVEAAAPAPVLLTGADRLAAVDGRLRQAEVDLYDHRLALLEADACAGLLDDTEVAAIVGPHRREVALLEARCRALVEIRDSLTT